MRLLFLIVIIISTLFLEIPVHGQVEQVTASRFHKSRNETISSAKLEKLIVSNRHGSIFYTGWSKDTITVNVNIWVEAPNQILAADVYERISSVSQQLSKGISFRTILTENFHSNYNFGIDYHIYGPENLQLEFLNIYGNIEMSHASGSLNVKLEHGDLKIIHQKAMIPSADISIKNGNLSAEKLRTSTIHHTNGQINILETETSNLQLDFSSGSIKKSDNLKINANTAKIELGTITSLSLNARHTYIEINEIVGYGNLEIFDGQISILQLSQELTELTISALRSPVLINPSQRLPYTLHGQITNGELTHSEDSKLRIFREENVTSFSGRFNEKRDQVASIILFATNSNITINHKR
jgi:hypothetical protein